MSLRRRARPLGARRAPTTAGRGPTSASSSAAAAAQRSDGRQAHRLAMPSSWQNSSATMSCWKNVRAAFSCRPWPCAGSLCLITYSNMSPPAANSITIARCTGVRKISRNCTMFGCTCTRARRSAAAPGPGPGARGRGAGGAGRTTHSRWFRISRSTLLFTPARARALQPLAARRGCARQHGAARSGTRERAGPPEPRSRNCGRAARAQQRQARASRGERQRGAHDSGRQPEQSGGRQQGRRTFIATCARTHRPDSAILLGGRRCDARQVHPGHCMACGEWCYVDAAVPSGAWPRPRKSRGCFASRTAAWQCFASQRGTRGDTKGPPRWQARKYPARRCC